MDKEPDMRRRKFLETAVTLTGGLAANVLTGAKAQASDRTTQFLRESDPMRKVVLDLGKKLSKYRAFLPNNFGANPEAEGEVDKLTTEYLNVYALSQRGLQPHQRTAEDDFYALKYAVDELREHLVTESRLGKKVDTSALKYLYDRLITEEGKVLLERQNNPRPTGPEREA